MAKRNGGRQVFVVLGFYHFYFVLVSQLTDFINLLLSSLCSVV